MKGLKKLIYSNYNKQEKEKPVMPFKIPLAKGGGSPDPPEDDGFFLLEDGDELTLENNDNLLLEN